jgi:quercetin dioxygenase-like cupin family protein
MKGNGVVLGLALGMMATAATSWAQDAAIVAADHCKVKTENLYVRVVECALKPGQKEAQHTHPASWYYVSSAGKMKVTYADGKTQMWEPPVGEAAWMEAEPAHTSENVGTTTLTFTLVEVKGAAAGTQKTAEQR